MLKEKDIKYLRTSQGKAVRVAVWVLIISALIVVSCGILNLRLAYKAKAKYNLTFVIPDKDDFYMKEKYLGAHLYAQDRFLTGLVGLLVGGIFLPTQIYVLLVLKGRNKRILKFIEEHTSEESKNKNVNSVSSTK